MAKFRFFGAQATYAGLGYSRYGQLVDMESGVANALIVASPPALLLPEELWDGIFLPGSETDAELAKFPSVTIHGTAPDEFRAKTGAVRKAFHEYREDLLIAAAPK